jgi:DNA-binding transcriptional LysR family regulator
LRPYAEQLLRTASLARQAVHELQPGKGGPLEIAAALSISVYFLPDVLKRFSRVHPKIVITIRSGHSKEVLDMVLGEEVEIGLARSLQHPEVETISLRDDPLLLMANPVHGPKHARRAHLEQVASWPLIFYERGSSDWTLTTGLFRRAGLMPNVALEVDSIETAKRMVERGLGLAFLPQMAVGQEIRRRKLEIVKILDAEPLGRSLDVIHPRHRPLRSEAQAFLHILRETINQASAK